MLDVPGCPVVTPPGPTPTWQISALIATNQSPPTPGVVVALAFSSWGCTPRQDSQQPFSGTQHIPASYGFHLHVSSSPSDTGPV